MSRSRVRVYLTDAPPRPRVLEPMQGEMAVVRALTQGHVVSLTRQDTNPGAADAGAPWWRDGITRLFDRGLLAPVRVERLRATWGWASPEDELRARRLVCEDPNMPFTWFAKEGHDPHPPSVAELVGLLAWDMRFEGTRILDVDATNPITTLVHEHRLYGVTQDWEAPTTAFDWTALSTFARGLSATQDPGQRLAATTRGPDSWYGPPRLPARVRAGVVTALRPHAVALFGEPRLRIDLTQWTVTAYGQEPAEWGDLLCADAKNALEYLHAPRFRTHTQFLRWAHRGGLDVAAPCATLARETAPTTLRLDPSTGLVKPRPVRDETVRAALDAAHLITALTGAGCVCARARTIMETTDPADLSTTAQERATEHDWATRSRAIARVANGYAKVRDTNTASAR